MGRSASPALGRRERSRPQGRARWAHSSSKWQTKELQNTELGRVGKRLKRRELERRDLWLWMREVRGIAGISGVSWAGTKTSHCIIGWKKSESSTFLLSTRTND